MRSTDDHQPGVKASRAILYILIEFERDTTIPQPLHFRESVVCRIGNDRSTQIQKSTHNHFLNNKNAIQSDLKKRAGQFQSQHVKHTRLI